MKYAIEVLIHKRDSLNIEMDTIRSRGNDSSLDEYFKRKIENLDEAIEALEFLEKTKHKPFIKNLIMNTRLYIGVCIGLALAFLLNAVINWLV